VAALVEVFGEIRRILRDDGTVWLNLGDRYATRPGKGTNVPQSKGGTPTYPDRAPHRSRPLPGIKPKDLIGIPWAVAFALRADGWYLRSDVIWAKPNPMPESVIDRPTSAHEHLFLLSKSPRYYYDADAIREPFADQRNGRDGGRRGRRPNVTLTTRVERPDGIDPSINGGRNKRNVWIVATQPFPEAHFATFPPRLVEPCVLGGSSQKACGRCGAPWQREAKRRRTFDGEVIENGGGWSGPDAPRRLNDGHGHYRWVTQVETLGWKPTCEHRDGTKRCVVLDPFAGSGTVGVVCASSGRDFIGIELNSEYAAMARRRIASQRDVVT
jgi:DNA modification methylase